MRFGNPVFRHLPCTVKSSFQLCGRTARQEGSGSFLVESTFNTLLQAAWCIHIGDYIVRTLKTGHKFFLVDFCEKPVQSVKRSSPLTIRLIGGVNHELTSNNAGFPFFQRILRIVGVLSCQCIILALLGHRQCHIVTVNTIAIRSERGSAGINENHVVSSGRKGIVDFLAQDNTFGIIFCETYYGNNLVFILFFRVAKLLDRRIEVGSRNKA